MIGPQLGLELAAIYLILILFGVGYNAAVAYLEDKKYSEGYVSDLVVIGVAVTILPFVALPGTFTAWQFVAFIIGGFIASGFPMLLGARVRHAKARKHEQQTTPLA